MIMTWISVLLVPFCIIAFVPSWRAFLIALAILVLIPASAISYVIAANVVAATGPLFFVMVVYIPSALVGALVASFRLVYKYAAR